MCSVVSAGAGRMRAPSLHVMVWPGDVHGLLSCISSLHCS